MEAESSVTASDGPNPAVIGCAGRPEALPGLAAWRGGPDTILRTAERPSCPRASLLIDWHLFSSTMGRCFHLCPPGAHHCHRLAQREGKASCKGESPGKSARAARQRSKRPKKTGPDSKIRAALSDTLAFSSCNGCKRPIHAVSGVLIAALDKRGARPENTFSKYFYHRVRIEYSK
jgi:hypothetical protein